MLYWRNDNLAYCAPSLRLALQPSACRQSKTLTEVQKGKSMPLLSTILTRHFLASIVYLCLANRDCMRSLKMFFVALALLHNSYGQETTSKSIDKIIFVAGDAFEDSKPFIKYVASLTHKTNPKICLIPTASADNPYAIVAWYASCVDLHIRPYVMRTFLSASPSQQTFEELILSMDAIIVGGGNTLNMLGVWKAQGIDTVLKKAYDKGIVLSGGSAGSLCWFRSGYSDSRPKEMTIIDGLGFLNFSHSPHYNSQPERRPLFQQGILSGKLKPGYACDDLAGLLFINGSLTKSVSQNAQNNSYFVSVVDGKIVEKLLLCEVIKE